MRTDICPHLHVYRYTYTECLAEINVGLEYGTLFLRRRRTARPISSHPRRRSGCINLTARAAHQVQSRADHAPCSRRVQRPWRQAGGRGWPKPALGVRRASLGGVAASRKGAISTPDRTHPRTPPYSNHVKHHKFCVVLCAPALPTASTVY